MVVKELFLNKVINENVYQVRGASYRKADNNKGYYLMRIGDKTGQIDAIWLNSTDINLKVGEFICVEGKVQNYQGRLQIKISSCYKVDPETINPEEFSLTAINEKELNEKLKHYVDSIKIKPLYDLIYRLLLEDLYKDFIQAPAATFNHHAYKGGLLEHSIAVAEICESFIKLYPEVKRDILIAGALLHDLGKIYEFEFGDSISYSSKGNLLGHIYMGAHKFQVEAAKEKDFPDYLNDQLTHIILSHHGILERGAPVEPCTLEAILVHKADTADADAKAFMLSEAEGAGGDWLLSRTLNRLIYVESPPKFEMR